MMTGASTSESPQHRPIPLQPWPLRLRIQYFLKIWVLKAMVKVIYVVLPLLKRSARSGLSTLSKAYPVRPKLTNRVFIPRNHEPHTLLPLYLDIHGGGFTIGAPAFDDEYCSHLANTYNILVVSIDYPKSPSATFPTPTEDIIAIVQSILSDTTLPIDHGRVAIGGFSAGGNLALSVAQAPELRNRIHGSVVWYPVIEWISNTELRLKTRPYRGPDDVDALASVMELFKWAYIWPGQDLADPRLSVKFAKKEHLPEWLFFIGAEYDLLCNEAKEMIMDIAGLEGKAREEGIYAFQSRTYKWRMARGVPHGFNFQQGQPKSGEEIRLKKCEETYTEVGEWLMRGPFAK